VSLFIAAGSVLWLIFVRGVGGYYLFVVIYGLSVGGLIALLGGAVGSFFGLTHLSELLGFLLGISVVFSAILPWLGGYIFDLTHSYFITDVITIVILIAAGVIAMLLRPPRPQPAYVALDGAR
jgi:OFA family oxalate/formate antiporter-like MFS transporter